MAVDRRRDRSRRHVVAPVAPEQCRWRRSLGPTGGRWERHPLGGVRSFYVEHAIMAFAASGRAADAKRASASLPHTENCATSQAALEDWRACPPDIFELLPPSLRSLSRRSLRIQERVIHLDQALAAARSPDATKRQSEVVTQHERLKAAFSN